MLNLFTSVRTIGSLAFKICLLALIFSTSFISLKTEAAPFCKDVQEPFPNWNSSNPYEVLGFTRQATMAEAQVAYRNLARRSQLEDSYDPQLKNDILLRLNLAIQMIRNSPGARYAFTNTTSSTAAQSVRRYQETQATKFRPPNGMREYANSNENAARALLFYFESIEKSQGVDKAAAILATLKIIAATRNRSEVGLYIANVFPRFLLADPDSGQLWEFARRLALNYRYYENPEKPDEEMMAGEIQARYQKIRESKVTSTTKR